jgi:hypothetical protein
MANNLYWQELQEANKRLEATKLQLDDTGIKRLQDTVKKYQDWKNVTGPTTGTASSTTYTGATITLILGHTHTRSPGRPVGSKTKDKEVIIQETVDRLIDQVVKLLNRHNFDEDRLNDADITVDEKANYAFVTITVGLPNGSIISVSERVKVANKTDPSKNWNKLNKGAYTGKLPVEPIEEDDIPILIDYNAVAQNPSS